MAYRLKSATKDLGGFNVSRILPNAQKRTVGPFVFIDHMGPTVFPAGQGINVRPHPHIGLATISYLMEGSMLHQDSLGSRQEIFPGDVNWMTAGRGIVHSERETIEVRAAESLFNGLQCWVALPEDKVDIDPGFIHIPKAQLPNVYRDKVMMRLIAGEAYNCTSPVKTYSPMFYLDVVSEKGAEIERPCDQSETAVYVVSGAVNIGGETFNAGDCVVLESEQHIFTSDTGRYFLLGGPALPKRPILRWNFLAYSKEKLDEAEERWKQGQLVIPSDDHEYIPLPK